MYLPQEILNAILEELHSDESTLASCALVSKAFTRRSQQLIFNDVDITFDLYDTSFNKTVRLALALSSAPSLGDHIRHLRIRKYTYPPTYASGGEEPHLGFNPSRNIEVLRSILSAPSTLDSFYISAVPVEARIGDSYSLVTDLVGMLRKTSAQDVTIRNILGIPPHVLAMHCPKIKKLEVDLGPLADSIGMLNALAAPFELSTPHPKEYGHLEVLVFHPSSWKYIQQMKELSSLPHTRLDLGRLREIVCFQPMHQAPVDLILGLAESGTIKRLPWNAEMWYLGLTRFSSEFSNAIINIIPHLIIAQVALQYVTSFPVPPSLESLRASFHIHNDDDSPVQWLNSLTNALRQNTQESAPLEELVIALVICEYPAILGPAWTWDGYEDQFRALDEILCHHAYSRLRRVELFVEFPGLDAPRHDFINLKSPQRQNPNSYMGCMIEKLRTHFPRIHAKGLLRVQWVFVEREQAIMYNFWQLRFPFEVLDKFRDGKSEGLYLERHQWWEKEQIYSETDFATDGLNPFEPASDSLSEYF
ncbi:hypothetical protein H0H81_012638 [Sphagnurus paluster]|uniref:F-box domain-containing protein n=1 Tax=Sphagnurus paluster TaxID=117069 RepID=A0A9P7GHW2_9AGAR|nr:hypothetical protein H0H81_012638 [Sphagnurus paluster]